MKVLLSPCQIMSRQSDIRKRFLEVLRNNPVTISVLHKKIGLSRPTLQKFIDEGGQLHHTNLYKILNYIELWEDVTPYD